MGAGATKETHKALENPHNRQYVEACYNKLDKNGDGLLDKKEFKEFIKNLIEEARKGGPVKEIIPMERVNNVTSKEVDMYSNQVFNELSMEVLGKRVVTLQKFQQYLYKISRNK